MVGLVECVTAWMEDHHGFARHKSALIVVGSVAVLSVVSALSYNVLADFKIADLTINDLMDFFSNQVLLPLGGLLIAVFVGWFVSRDASVEELEFSSPLLFKLWHVLVRYVVPPAVAVIFYFGVSE